jgi:probable rRNA maturation factor
MIRVHCNASFRLKRPEEHKTWIGNAIKSEGYSEGDINYVFTGDEELLEMNRRYLNHDYYTDILTFDYTNAGILSGDIFISVERVKENAHTYGVAEDNELRRVMVHGILHLMGYPDKTAKEKAVMRIKENEKLELFHVEQ